MHTLYGKTNILPLKMNNNQDTTSDEDYNNNNNNNMPKESFRRKGRSKSLDANIIATALHKLNNNKCLLSPTNDSICINNNNTQFSFENVNIDNNNNNNNNNKNNAKSPKISFKKNEKKKKRRRSLTSLVFSHSEHSSKIHSDNDDLSFVNKSKQ